MKKNYLNFFVIGAAKAGTTSVFERLNARLDVYLSPLKEPNYYSSDIDTSRFSPEFIANTRLDLTDYLSQSPLPILQIGFIRDASEYASLFEHAPSTTLIRGECSTSYLFSEAAPAALAAEHPDAQILIMLRNPIDRLYSHYMMARKYGFTSLPLREAVEKDLAHPSPGWGESELFVQLGLYSDQVSRWRAHFPEAQIKIMLTEDLSLPHKWQSLLDWLKLPQGTAQQIKSDSNIGGLARFEKLNRFLTLYRLKHKLGNFIPSGIKKKLLAFYYNSDALPSMTAEEKEYLTGIYAEEILRLQRDLKLEVGHWI